MLGHRSRWLIGVLFLLCLSSGGALASPEKAPLVFAQGEQRLLRIPGLVRFSLGSGVVRSQPLHSVLPDASPEYLLLKAMTPGTADLWIWKKDGGSEHRSIRVEKMVANEVRPGLERALGSLEEAEVIYSGSGVILRGELQTLEEAARVVALASAYKEIHDETECSDGLLEIGKSRLENAIRKSGLSAKLELTRVGQDLYVRGGIDNPTERASVESRLHSAFPPVHLELLSLPDTSPTIHFRVFLLELKKNRFHNLGISWPDVQEGAFQVTPVGISNLLQLDLALHTLEGEGSAKILSSPELVVRAPGEAELFAGGEIPIHTQSKFFSSITWKDYGLTLKLKVTATTREQVRLDIYTEVSHLDPTVATDNHIPGIQANRMKTQVDAHYGAPLLLSGLLQQGTREQARGLPVLREIPVLGALFGSEDYLKERSELVAILLPSATPPSPPMAKIARYAPKGILPPPRVWMSPSEERELRRSPEFPWNAFQ